ncbi:MAG: chloramphenicol acetyltransferase [Anaerolineales bacterium]|nr:chloramphenicol acetyltransferase [Anaerolineales bacterium]
MRIIDMQTWSRREHFRVFSAFDHPHFNMCADVDLTKFLPFVKHNDISFTVAVVYTISRIANEIPEFRYRIRGEEVVEHAIVHPSTTILVDEELFSFCYFRYQKDFSNFSADAAEQIARVKAHLTLQNEPGDDALYMTAIPWVSFTSFMHPMHLNPVDSIPRFAWGKFSSEANAIKMPLSVQGHHALMDGIHMGKFYMLMQEALNQPECVLR